MPGTKTFTSIKSNEWLEFNLVQELRKMNENQNYSLKIVAEFFRLIFSAAITSVIFLSTNILETFKDAAGANNLWLMIKDATLVLGLFVGFYFIVFWLGKAVSFLFDLFFNNRLLKKNKEKYRRFFYSRTYNMIMLGMSFENKSRYYSNEFSGDISKKSYDEIIKSSHSLDLVIMYLSQAIYYFDTAERELNDIIPNSMSGKKEEKNVEFLNYIGVSNMRLGINASINSLCRLHQSALYLASLSNLKSDEFTDNIVEIIKNTNDLLGRYRLHFVRMKAVMTPERSVKRTIESKGLGGSAV